MSIQLLKKNMDTDVDMDSYKRNLLRHRLRYVVIVLVLLLAMAAGVVGIRKHMENKIYQTYEVVESFARTDTMMTQYTEFQDYVLKYGKDGICDYCKRFCREINSRGRRESVAG